MTALRIINLLVWAGVLLYMSTGAYKAVFGRQLRRGDPMLIVFVTAFVIIGFTTRWLVALLSVAEK